MMGKLLPWLLAAPLLAATSPLLAQQPTQASIKVSPSVRDIFERDWVLMNWALKFYDGNHDILLSDDEARSAAAEFRRMADTNGDGRVTPDEYRAARAFILARY